MSAAGIEWLNENALRSYPIKEDCSRVPSVGGSLLPDVVLPNYMIVDLVITTPADSVTQAYISRVVVVDIGLSISIAAADGTLMAMVAIDMSAHVKNQGYTLVGTGIYEDVRGRIVIGDLTNLYQDLPEGIYAFDLAAAEFESTTIRPDLRSVRSLQLGVGSASSQYISGRVKLLAGTNVNLTYLPGYNAIRIDAISADGLNEVCDCGPIGKETVVKTVNGIPVENLTIVGDSCIEVTTSGNTIQLRDKCSAPCCGCTELEFITTGLKTLEVTVANLQVYSTRLSERINTFVSTFVLTITA